MYDYIKEVPFVRTALAFRVSGNVVVIDVCHQDINNDR